jgi:hypothetical protein
MLFIAPAATWNFLHLNRGMYQRVKARIFTLKVRLIVFARIAVHYQGIGLFAVT